jgi:hypothetical protein
MPALPPGRPQARRTDAIAQVRRVNLKLSCSKLDFIEKYAASSRSRDVKNYFLLEDLVRPFEREPEASEVSERTPASPHVGPVEQLEAIRLWERLQPGERRAAARVDQRVATTGFYHVDR